MMDVKIHDAMKIKASMKIFVDMYEGNRKDIGYTFRNDKLNPKIKRQLDSIKKQMDRIYATQT